MSVTEYSKSVIDRKEIKQRHFCKTLNHNFIRTPDKNAKIAICRTCDEDTSIHRERNNVVNPLRRKEKGEIPYEVDGHQMCNWYLNE